MFPENWKWVALGEVARVSSGATPSRTVARYWNGLIPWVTTGEINYSDIFDTQEKITEEAVGAASLKLNSPGTILLAMIGQGATRGRAARLKVPATTNQNCCAIAPYPIISSDFLYYYLENQYKAIRNLSNAGGQQNLNAELIRNIAVPLPPLPQQNKIAEIFSAWDRTLDLTAQLITTKQRYKRGLMQQLLMGKRRLPAFSDKNWSKSSFGWVFRTKSVRNSGSQITNSITVGKYAIRPQNEHFNRIIASDNLENYSIIRQGDFVYDPMSAYYGAFGRYDLDQPGIVSPVYRVLAINPGYDSDFFKHFIKSHYIAYQLAANSSQGNKEGKRRTIQAEAFDSITFTIPGLEEQQAIAQVLNACDREIALLELKLKLLKKQKQGLMQQLLTGKLRVSL